MNHRTTLKMPLVGMTGLVAALAAVPFNAALASGFEKSIVWGGRSAGLAGIATPYIQGADALYFNPAGLAGDKTGQSVSFNLSPTSSQFKGPINNNNDVSSSDQKLSLPFGLIYGNTLNEKLGFGIGAFVSGGAQATFNDVDFSSLSGYKAEVKTDLSLIEFSAGAGYKVSDDLKLGASWRVVMAQADFSFVKRSNPSSASFINAKLTGLKDTQALAFRLGGQYKLDESTEIGLTYRTEVNFEAKGKVSGQVTSGASGLAAANPAIAEADATARTTFPMAIVLGGSHKLSDEWSFFGEYAWTQYSRIGEITVQTTSSIIANTQLTTVWRDQHNVRLAAEYGSGDWPIRFGYGYTSAVTNGDYARASFTPPGAAHTLTVGTGQTFKIGEHDLKYDGAIEYTMISADVGSGAAAGVATAGNDTRNGTYSTSAYVAHLALSYLF